MTTALPLPISTSHFPPAQFPHGSSHLPIPEGIDEGVEHGCDDCVEHSHAPVLGEVTGRADVNKRAGPKVQDYHNDVGSACGQGLVPPRQCLAPQGNQDDHVGCDQDEEAAQGDDSAVGHRSQALSARVGAGQVEQGVDITKVVGDFVGATEREQGSGKGLEGVMQEAPCPGDPHHVAAQAAGHERGVAQGPADGHVAVVGHGCQDENLCAAKKMNPEELPYATCKGDGVISHQEARNHLRSCDRGETNIYKGQVAEEEVHGGVQVPAAHHSENYEEISCHCERVEKQEHHKIYFLHPLVLWEAQEDEFLHAARVFLANILDNVQCRAWKCGKIKTKWFISFFILKN